MSIYKLSLINNLLQIINSTTSDNPNYVLAKYFLEHYLELSDTNIYKLADDCFVSRSSVRRFCKSMGYENFKSLKNQIKSISHEYEYFMHLQTNHKTLLEYSQWTEKEILDMPKDVNRNISSDDYNRIVTQIHESNYPILLSSYSSNMVLLEFQRPLVLSGKIVHVMSDTNIDEESLLNMNENDYLMVVSSSGQFAKEIDRLLAKVNARKVLVTASREKTLVEL